jgi:hypothetical protein
MVEVLEDHSDDETLNEILGFIDSLNSDEQIDLVALMWLGHESYTADDWPQI